MSGVMYLKVRKLFVRWLVVSCITNVVITATLISLVFPLLLLLTLNMLIIMTFVQFKSKPYCNRVIFLILIGVFYNFNHRLYPQ